MSESIGVTTGRIPITDVSPLIECGRLPIKAVPGESFVIGATIFREGHDALGANVVLRHTATGRELSWTPMRSVGIGTDRYEATLCPDAEGDWTYTVEAWGDPITSWRHAAEAKIPANVDVEITLEQGAQLYERACPGVPEQQRAVLADAVTALRDTSRPAAVRLSAATAPRVLAVLDRYPLRDPISRSEPFALRVDRERALLGAWYEFFPRSEGAHLDPETGKWVSGTFETAAERLPAIAEMGFDVVYLPPIHPIGRVNRKGRNNALIAETGEPGSPWAIGAAEGGHDAVHPELGSIEDFDKFAGRVSDLGMELALDLALQCAPDHPWVQQHPEWFTTLPDGSIAYAENPPKKYQDIYPLNFDNDPDGLYAEVLRVVRHWIRHGVTIFRVDNPHTKPVPFWERLLAEVRRTNPEVLFLAEAFTRPAMLHRLAQVGFHQSYTYFTWRNAKWEIEQYLAELSNDTAHFLRPNFFVNTPDILTAYLQYGGPAAFKIRAVLASMTAPSYGVYSGYELFEHVALRPGSEEYLDSEKYQYRPRDWAAAAAAGHTLAPYLRRLNELRRNHPALRRLRNLRLHHIPNDAMLAFSKREGSDVVIVILALDPHAASESTVTLDMPALGMEWHDTFTVHDELSGMTWTWGQENYVRLDPAVEPAHILTVREMSRGKP